jgi:hypothetical protein
MRFTEQGQKQVAGSLADALARLRRRRAAIREQLGALEVEEADLAKFEAAILAAVELVKASGPIPRPEQHISTSKERAQP